MDNVLKEYLIQVKEKLLNEELTTDEAYELTKQFIKTNYVFESNTYEEVIKTITKELGV